MPLDFLTEAQVARYGRFDGVPPRADLDRFFVLDDADMELVAKRRGEHNRLGFSLVATTLRYVGLFLEDPLAVPWPVVQYLAEQLGIDDPSCVKRYTERQMTAYESPTPLVGSPFRAENGLGCPLTSLLLDPVEVVYVDGT